MATATTIQQGDLTILICTANMGNKEPQPSDIGAWVPESGYCTMVTPLNDQVSFEGKESFDLVAIGMQEATWSASSVKDSNVEEDKDASDNEDDTNNKNGDNKKEEQPTADVKAEEEQVKKDVSRISSLLEGSLGSSYKMMAEKSRGQMRLVIFVKAELESKFTDLDIKCENTGIAHVLANKGGIVMSMTYEQTRISFLSAHLAAHEGDNYYAARCDNINEIFGGAKTHERYDVALSSHHFFIMGDLNFRTRFEATDEDPSVKQALALVNEGKFEELYEHDELTAGIKKGDLLVDFETLPCHFSPTFKVLREAGFVYKEQRTPSYTDRILFRSAVKDLLTPLAYEPCPDFTTSDHKPIRGAFCITPNAVVDTKEADAAPSSYHLKFSKMSCKDLPVADITGSSDPYIMFTWEYASIASDFEHKGLMKWTSPKLRKWPKTQHQRRELNPVYKGEEIDLWFNGSPIPAEAMLYVTVMDWDLGNQDDLMGTLPLNLKEVVSGAMEGGKTKATVEFDQPLIKYGKHSGSIKLTIDIEKSNEPVKVAEEKKGFFASIFGCCS